MSSKTDENETTVATIKICTIQNVNETAKDVDETLEKLNDPLCTIQHVNEKIKNTDKTPDKLNDPHEATQNDKIIKASKHDRYTTERPLFSGRRDHREERRIAARPVNVDDEELYVRDASAYRSGRRSPRHHSEPVYIGSDDVFHSFEDVYVRHAFVRKVYTLLCLQLLFTFGFILTSSLVREVKYFMMEYYYLVFVALGGMTITFCMLACYQSIRRTTPINYIVFILCTMFFAYEFAFLSIYYTTHTIALAIGLTLVACVCITIFAIQTSCDITGWGMYLCVGMTVVLVFGLIVAIISMFTYIPILHAVYAGLIGIVFSFYLVYDTQQIVGGRRVNISPEEYIMGALQLYIDVMYIFYSFMQIIGIAKG